jgi:ankyrin repeat protein
MAKLTHNFSTPLHLAVNYGADKTTDILLEAGADPTIACPNWTSVLHIVSDRKVLKVRHTYRLKSVADD